MSGAGAPKLLVELKSGRIVNTLDDDDVLWAAAEHYAQTGDAGPIENMKAYMARKAGKSGPEGPALRLVTDDEVDEHIEIADPARTAARTGQRGATPTPTQEIHERGDAVDAADLLTKDLPPLRWAVPGLLPEGLGILAAPPKAGKSVLAYQLAVELTLGHSILGRNVERRPVLYYALEDGERRSQDRVRAALGDRTLPRGLMLRWDAPRIGAGLEDEISTYLEANPFGVVILDVLSKVRPSGKAGLNAYDEDYNALAGLHRVTKEHPGSAILVITHDRKAGSEDWVTRITGTRGIAGASDFSIFIERKRGQPSGSIYVTGRDAADDAIEVAFLGSHWALADMTAVIGAASPTRQTIYQYVKAHGPVHQKALAAGTGLSETVVYNRVRDMTKDGQLLSVPGGYIVSEDEHGSQP